MRRTTNPDAPGKPRPFWPTIAILIMWGVGTVVVFWYLEWQYLRPVSRPEGASELRPETRPPTPIDHLDTDRGRITLANGSSGEAHPITVLNFWSPTCPCSRYMEAHVRQLVGRFEPQGVRFITLVECGTSEAERTSAGSAWKSRSGGAMAGAMALDAGGEVARAFGVWAAPGAVVLNGNARVVYVGAYNAARYCDNQQTAWAERAIEAILENRPPPYTRTPFFGCRVLASVSLSHRPSGRVGGAAGQ